MAKASKPFERKSCVWKSSNLLYLWLTWQFVQCLTKIFIRVVVLPNSFHAVLSIDIFKDLKFWMNQIFFRLCKTQYKQKYQNSSGPHLNYYQIQLKYFFLRFQKKILNSLKSLLISRPSTIPAFSTWNDTCSTMTLWKSEYLSKSAQILCFLLSKKICLMTHSRPRSYWMFWFIKIEIK